MSDQINDLKKRLRSARGRVAYWSNRPSFRGFGFKQNSRRAKTGAWALEYEQALDDVRNLASVLSELTGRAYAVTDLMEEFRLKFSRADIKND